MDLSFPGQSILLCVYSYFSVVVALTAQFQQFSDAMQVFFFFFFFFFFGLEEGRMDVLQLNTIGKIFKDAGALCSCCSNNN